MRHGRGPGVLDRPSEHRGHVRFADTGVTQRAEGAGGPQGPAVLHTVEEVTAALAGLDVVRAGRIRRPARVDGEDRFAIDTLVRARRP